LISEDESITRMKYSFPSNKSSLVIATSKKAVVTPAGNTTENGPEP